MIILFRNEYVFYNHNFSFVLFEFIEAVGDVEEFDNNFNL